MKMSTLEQLEKSGKGKTSWNLGSQKVEMSFPVSSILLLFKLFFAESKSHHISGSRGSSSHQTLLDGYQTPPTDKQEKVSYTYPSCLKWCSDKSKIQGGRKLWQLVPNWVSRVGIMDSDLSDFSIINWYSSNLSFFFKETMFLH